jgi:hypothetical protein
MKIETLGRNLRILPTRLKTLGKYLSEADFSGFDTVNSVVHLGYCKNRLKYGLDLLYLPSVIEKLGNYETYLQKAAHKINELRENEEAIIHILEIDHWKYLQPVVSPAENEYLVFTRNGSPNFYLPGSESFFKFLKNSGIKKTRIMGEVASSPKIYISETKGFMKFVPSEGYEDAGCLRSICDMFLWYGFEVEPLVDCSYPYKWPSSLGQNAYYRKRTLNSWHDMGESLKWESDILEY